jgi:hypothetical protein
VSLENWASKLQNPSPEEIFRYPNSPLSPSHWKKSRKWWNDTTPESGIQLDCLLMDWKT